MNKYWITRNKMGNYGFHNIRPHINEISKTWEKCTEIDFFDNQIFEEIYPHLKITKGENTIHNNMTK